ncbi:MAG: RtcB family protein [Gammaproteobacteria bacterium]|nr:MAG: RtcB family protein [Gammaproteobacteria bacterium]UCH39807.1 MAG: RtcB family protein [Gammaproteobacteria bacterium]
MIKMKLTKGKSPVLVWTDEVESSAHDQLARMANLPIVHSHIAVMPDVHMGKGATVGSVIPTRAAIIPAAVGVDIGCGMCAVRTSLTAIQLPESLREVRNQIERDVPVGFDMHSNRRLRFKAAAEVEPGLRQILDRHPGITSKSPNKDSWARQIGTLGGGNHFIELCLDEEDRVWVMLHSGSRGIGNKIGQYFIEKAKEVIARSDIRLPDRDLAWLTEGTGLFGDYWHALTWAQEYAARNRQEMLDIVLEALARKLPPFELEEAAINCHHNYASREVHDGSEIYVTRKGAIRAGAGELGIIPGSMGARSYIVRGKGNEKSFCSCAHGAGRRMSRSAARKHFTREDLVSQTEGVECRKDKGVIDEIPGAYKDIDQVMENQADLVDVVHTLKQVLCVKG